MDGQRQRSSGGRRRRRKSRGEPRANAEPVLIAARRPNSPLLNKAPSRAVAASASPKKGRRANGAGDPEPEATETDTASEPRRADGAPRRAARIVRPTDASGDEREQQRARLLDRLMSSEGRGAISRAANEYLESGHTLPSSQEVHLQLLEHFDEELARESIKVMGQLLEGETPVKKPVLDQRLRRLEEYADEPVTRDLAASLRRVIRS